MLTVNRKVKKSTFKSLIVPKGKKSLSRVFYRRNCDGTVSVTNGVYLLSIPFHAIPVDFTGYFPADEGTIYGDGSFADTCPDFDAVIPDTTHFSELRQSRLVFCHEDMNPSELELWTHGFDCRAVDRRIMGVIRDLYPSVSLRANMGEGLNTPLGVYSDDEFVGVLMPDKVESRIEDEIGHFTATGLPVAAAV